MPKKLNRYQALIQKIFFDHYTDSATDFEFVREELDKGAAELGFAQVKNLGDVPYSFRYRNDLPDSILETQPEGLEWIIEGAGKGRYRFKLVKENRIVPRENQAAIDIPDATPELIRAYALDDEQALLGRVGGVVAEPLPPQTRACAIDALGSSPDRFAQGALP